MRRFAYDDGVKKNVTNFLNLASITLSLLTLMGLFDFFRRKKPATSPAKQPLDVGARLCFVLCRDTTPNDLARASAVAADIFGYGYTADVSGESLVSINHGDETVGFLMHVPVPIPEREAEVNAAGNFLWPQGEEEAAAHRAHVIVTLAGKGESPVAEAMLVTRLALVALELFDGLGVYWGNASVTNSRELFEQCAREMTDTHLPLPIWLRYQPVRADAADNTADSPAEIGMYTLGLKQFGLMEIEIDRCGMDLGELFDFVSNLAHYLVMSGPVIKDGNTVGGSEEERILVRYRPSMIDRTRRVYKVIFE